jgi:hypothetical protein
MTSARAEDRAEFRTGRRPSGRQLFHHPLGASQSLGNHDGLHEDDNDDGHRSDVTVPELSSVPS